MNWQRLNEIAREETRAMVRSLMRPLRERALDLPLVLEKRPTASLEEENGDDLLGLFVGPALAERDAIQAPASVPAHIVLFLDNLWEYSHEDENAFREEVRITYLHELGHYLGLDEDDLIQRGID